MFVILYICWDTPSGKTGLWQLPIASVVFQPFRSNNACMHTYRVQTRMHIGLCCMLMALKWLPATMCSKKTTIPHYTAFAYNVVIQIQTKSLRKQKIGRLETNTRPVPNNYRFPALCVHTTSSKEGQIPQKEKSHRSKHLDWISSKETVDTERKKKKKKWVVYQQ